MTLKEEIVLKKTTSDTFTGTTLNLILRNNNIDKLVICGALRSCCVESIARIAFNLGYLPTVVDDAHLAADKNFHNSALVMETNEKIRYLEKS